MDVALARSSPGTENFRRNFSVQGFVEILLGNESVCTLETYTPAPLPAQAGKSRFSFQEPNPVASL